MALTLSESAAGAFRSPFDKTAELMRIAASMLTQLPRQSAVLLRPVVEPFDAVNDDIDLLISDVAREQLLQLAYEIAETGMCHVHILRHRSDKVQLTLILPDGSSRLKFDLWTVFAQMALRPEYRIPAEQILMVAQPRRPADHRCGTISDALGSLPPDLEFCLYVQHLESRRKPVDTERVQLRLTALKSRLMDQCHSEVCYIFDSLHKLLMADAIPRAVLLQTHMHLLRELTDRTGMPPQQLPRPTRWKRLKAEYQRAVQRLVPCVAVCGSDGVGKTSILEQVSLCHPQAVTVMTAKKLYRRSWGYQLLGGLLRRTRMADRRQFDEWLATPLTLRAAAALWLRYGLTGIRTILGIAANAAGLAGLSAIVKPRRLRLLDRSLFSFWVVGRMQASPRVARGWRWLRGLLPPARVALFVASWQQISERKQELSAVGHARYQQLLFDIVMQSVRVDLLIFSNSGPGRQQDAGAEGPKDLNSRFIDAGTMPNVQPDARFHASVTSSAAVFAALIGVNRGGEKHSERTAPQDSEVGSYQTTVTHESAASQHSNAGPTTFIDVIDQTDRKAAA